MRPGHGWPQPRDLPCAWSASCSSRSAFGPTPCSLTRSAAGTPASWPSSVYPAAVRARVAGAPIFRGRPGSGVAMARSLPALRIGLAPVAVGGIPLRRHLIGWGVGPVDRPFLAVDRLFAVGRYVVPVSGPPPAAPGRPHDQPEHHPEDADEHQDVTDRVDSDAMRGHGGDPEPQDGSYRDEQKTCTYPHGPTSLSEFWSATPSSPRLWPQTDALPGDRGPARSDGSDPSGRLCRERYRLCCAAGCAGPILDQ